MKYVLYGSGSSGNHGCEAIIRGTQELLKGDGLFMSDNIEEDVKYGIDRIVKIDKGIDNNKPLLAYLIAYIRLKIFNEYAPMDAVAYLNVIKKSKKHASVAISIGGDVYCYGGEEFYGYLNKLYNKNGFKTVLWGCSIEPSIVSKIEKDLKRYDTIVTRESITYKAISEICPNTVLAPDPAFYMETCEFELPSLFSEPVIGINISPMITSFENREGIAYKNYHKLINYILENTTDNIALIPHVVWENNDDITILNKLLSEFAGSDRITLIEDNSAPQLKYVISKCSFFIGARTHSTIAAYSTYVPTLVVGYSVKARGIARDIFGTEEGYVLPVQNLESEDDLTKCFVSLYEKKDEIREHLETFIPEYKRKGKETLRNIGILQQ